MISLRKAADDAYRFYCVDTSSKRGRGSRMLGTPALWVVTTQKTIGDMPVGLGYSRRMRIKNYQPVWLKR